MIWSIISASRKRPGRLSENRNLSEVRRRGVEIDAPIYIDPKRPIAVKNDPSAVANSMLNLIDDDSEVKDVSEFVGSKFKEDNLATSISKLQQAMKERNPGKITGLYRKGKRINT